MSYYYINTNEIVLKPLDDEDDEIIEAKLIMYSNMAYYTGQCIHHDFCVYTAVLTSFI